MDAVTTSSKGPGTAGAAERCCDEQSSDRLDSAMRELVARQEMLFLSTADRHGVCDSSFRAGARGFVQVLDERTLAFPEYGAEGGTSLDNIRDNPRVGLLLIDLAGDRVGLHVTGRARVVSDSLMRALHRGLSGATAQSWVEVQIERAYTRCVRHVARQAGGDEDAGRPARGSQEAGSKPTLVDGERHRVERLPVRSEHRDHSAAPARRALSLAPEPGSGPRRDPFTAPVPADPQAWRRAAEEVLAEARQRALAGAARSGRRPGGENAAFRGWFA